jgi:hypothetical protein
LEIDEVNFVCIFAGAYHKCLWLNVPMQVATAVHHFEPLNYFYDQNQHSRQRELKVYKLEKLLQART